MTGFTRATVNVLLERAEGRCEAALDGCTVAVADAQHRRPRGTGGTRRADTNGAANGLAVCRPCHTRIEHDLAVARHYGWSVSLHEADPSSVPVLRRDRWVWLHDDGGWSPCDMEQLERMELEDMTERMDTQ